MNDKGGPGLQRLHGFDAKLSPGDTMSEARVLKWFKPAIFNTNDPRIVNFHNTSLQQRIERVRIWAETSGIEPQSMPRLTVEALYANLLEYAYHITQDQINEEFSGLMFRDDDGMLQRLREVEVDVALPVSANPQPRHVKTVLSAARIAGLPPATRSVAEPAAAVVYLLQMQEEDYVNDGVPESQTVLLLDAGEGSIDATLCWVKTQCQIDLEDNSVSETRICYTFREEVARMTEWAGGSFANDAFHEFLETRHGRDFDKMLSEAR